MMRTPEQFVDGTLSDNESRADVCMSDIAKHSSAANDAVLLVGNTVDTRHGRESGSRRSDSTLSITGNCAISF